MMCNDGPLNCEYCSYVVDMLDSVLQYMICMGRGLCVCSTKVQTEFRQSHRPQ